MTDKPVEAMSAEELAHHLHIWVDKINGPAFDEMCARLRERDAANNRIEQLLENMANLESPFERGAIYAANEVLSAMLAARAERKE